MPSTDEAKHRGDPSEARGRTLLVAWVHIAVLWSFAFAQPLFDVLADSPEFFVARGNTTGDIVALAFGLVLIPPTLLWAVELALIRMPRTREAAHLCIVGALVVAIALQAFKDLRSGPGVPLTLAALACGAGAAILYARAPAARATLTVLAPAPALFLVLFLVASPVSDLFKSDDDVEVRDDVRASAPVVVIVFDEFSVETLMDLDGSIDESRFPNFAALAESATWYRNATTISDHTTDAVPAILSSRYPTKDSLPTAAHNPRNLFTLLGGAYSLENVNEPSTDLCPGRLCTEVSRLPTPNRLRSLAKDLTIVALHRVLPNRFAEELPAVNQGFGNFAAQGRDDPGGGDADGAIPAAAFADRPGQLERLVEGLQGDEPHRLAFLHVLLPHTPWQYLPTGQQYTPPPGPDVPGLSGGGLWTRDPVLPQQALQRNLLQVGAVDRLVGRLVHRLREEGLYDRTLLVLTADHGISFRPGTSRRGAEGEAAADVMGVPLFVKAPRQPRGGVDNRPATTADVLPTIADALDIDVRWPTAGRSLIGPPAPRATELRVSVFPDRELVSLPFVDYVRARDKEVVRMRFRQGPGQHGWGGVYAMGGDSDLFGRRVAALRVGPRTAAAVELEHSDSFESVEPRGAVVPSFVRGRFTRGGRPGLRTAVAVNGTIRSVAPTYEDDGETRFGALVPPSAFRAGDNDVSVYLIAGAGASRRLSPVAHG